MPTFTQDIGGMSLASYYSCTTLATYSWTTPSLAARPATVDLTSIPAGSTISKATITWSSTSGNGTFRVNGSVQKPVNITGSVIAGQTSKVHLDYRATRGGESPLPSYGQTKQYSKTGWFYGLTVTVVYEPPYSKGTLDEQSLDAGDTVTLTVTPSLPEYTHKAQFYLGSDVSTATYKSANLDVPSSNTLAYTVPMDWLNGITDKLFDTAHVKLSTYKPNGDLSGSVTYDFTVNVPASVVPTITGLTATRVNESSAQNVGEYVAGHSKARISATVASLYGASIVSTVITHGIAQGASLPYLSGFLTQGDNNFVVTITDSRGRQATATKTVTALAYEPPQFSMVNAYRAKPNLEQDAMGTVAALKAMFACSPVGTNTTTCTVATQTGDYPYSSESNVQAGSVMQLRANLPVGETLKVRLTLSDKLMTVVHNLVIPTARFPIHFKNGGRGVAFGMVSETDDCVQIADGWSLKLGDTDIQQSITTAATQSVAQSVQQATVVNLLDNSDFDIAQAGYGGTHNGVAYACDRWKLVSGTFTASKQLNGTIRQQLEKPPFTDVTAFVHCTSGTASITYSNGVVEITSSGGVLQYAALYQGTIASANEPLYVRPETGIELMKCQRYYVNNYYPNEAGTRSEGYVAAALSSEWAAIAVRFPIPMRALPEIEFKGTWAVAIAGTIYAASNTAIFSDYRTHNGFMAQFKRSGGFTDKAAMRAKAFWAANADIEQ